MTGAGGRARAEGAAPLGGAGAGIGPGRRDGLGPACAAVSCPQTSGAVAGDRGCPPDRGAGAASGRREGRGSRGGDGRRGEADLERALGVGRGGLVNGDSESKRVVEATRARSAGTAWNEPAGCQPSPAGLLCRARPRAAGGARSPEHGAALTGVSWPGLGC